MLSPRPQPVLRLSLEVITSLLHPLGLAFCRARTLRGLSPRLPCAWQAGCCTCPFVVIARRTRTRRHPSVPKVRSPPPSPVLSLQYWLFLIVRVSVFCQGSFSVSFSACWSAGLVPKRSSRRSSLRCLGFFPRSPMAVAFVLDLGLSPAPSGVEGLGTQILQVGHWE